MKLNFAGNVPPADLVGRIVGPDTAKGYAEVVSASYDAERDVTVAKLRPSVSDTDVVFDAHGQMWGSNR